MRTALKFFLSKIICTSIFFSLRNFLFLMFLQYLFVDSFILSGIPLDPGIKLNIFLPRIICVLAKRSGIGCEKLLKKYNWNDTFQKKSFKNLFFFHLLAAILNKNREILKNLGFYLKKINQIGCRIRKSF